MVTIRLDEVGAVTLTASTGHEVKAAIMVVTPKLAETWLEENDKNYRKLNTNRAARFGCAIERGDWEFNGASIKFDQGGKLVDGQHRLMGCALSGVDFETLVLWGIDKNTELDRGMGRKLSDELRRRGVKSAVAVGSVLQHLWRLQHGTTALKAAQDVSVMLRFYDALDPDAVVEAVRNGERVRSLTHRGVAQFAALWLHLLLTPGVHRSDLDDFWRCLASGDGVMSSDPVGRLRSWFMKEATMRVKTRRTSTEHVMAIVVKAWNRWITNGSVTNLSWRRFGPKAEKFPRVENGK